VSDGGKKHQTFSPLERGTRQSLPRGGDLTWGKLKGDQWSRFPKGETVQFTGKAAADYALRGEEDPGVSPHLEGGVSGKETTSRRTMRWLFFFLQ